jgi:hypothetical protein
MLVECIRETVRRNVWRSLDLITGYRDIEREREREK